MDNTGTRAASAVVLAGGLSRRLGADKRRLRLWGEAGPTLLERTVATAGALCADEEARAALAGACESTDV